uniref:CCHC-type domain-containing protein n=1 Tax=Oryzias sinensis TaxID=183150 RepID=A0A8C7X8W2_9TELE
MPRESPESFHLEQQQPQPHPPATPRIKPQLSSRSPATSKALRWAQAFLAVNHIPQLPLERFISEFRLVFDRPKKQEEATRRLLSLKQGNRSVCDHVIDFRILAVEAGWTDPALRGIFYHSLNDHIKDHLCTQPEATGFEGLVNAALRSDTRLRERKLERTSQPHTPLFANQSPSSIRPTESPAVLPHKSPEKPMQICHSKLSAEERQKRSEEGLCFYCGNPGHQVSQCKLHLNSRTPR